MDTGIAKRGHATLPKITSVERLPEEVDQTLGILPTRRRSKVIAQGVELFEQRLIERAGKFNESVTNRDNISLRLLQKNAFDVFQITWATGEHLMHDKVFDGGESNVGGTDVDNSGSGDGVAFIRRERKNEINPDAGLRIDTGHDHRPACEGVGVGQRAEV
ncbi:MAG: hypothetical protein NNA21_08055 [Nitrospira sp.]|nr:hypothetical protein [Nitrospira sp.]MCP9462189.1 hypothetical protein [Nitrospira sp.]MCP9471454.1 hypothetical protein [Nitrospira sp.]MCP9474955.1 hypothetical protein [Nitrospira sp.]